MNWINVISLFTKVFELLVDEEENYMSADLKVVIKCYNIVVRQTTVKPL